MMNNSANYPCARNQEHSNWYDIQPCHDTNQVTSDNNEIEWLVIEMELSLIRLVGVFCQDRDGHSFHSLTQ